MTALTVVVVVLVYGLGGAYAYWCGYRSGRAAGRRRRTPVLMGAGVAQLNAYVRAVNRLEQHARPQSKS